MKKIAFYWNFRICDSKSSIQNHRFKIFDLKSWKIKTEEK